MAWVLAAVTCLVETKYHFGYTRFNCVNPVPYSYLTVIFLKKSKYNVYMLKIMMLNSVFLYVKKSLIILN